MAKFILAWSKTGEQFYREIGKRENGRPVRFYLGADENPALARVSRLEALWNGVVTWWNDLNAGKSAHTEFACWDETTLALGRAIGRGEWSVRLQQRHGGSRSDEPDECRRPTDEAGRHPERTSFQQAGCTGDTFIGLLGVDPAKPDSLSVCRRRNTRL
jgi:hypothetical protein